MTTPDSNFPAPPLPRLPAALLRRLLPHAERAEVLADLADEYRDRRADRGRLAARLWLWRQVLGSQPPLLRRSWWRGWTGFEPRANRYRPGGPNMESWIMDVRFALRRLRQRPTYTLLAVLTLALGVGGTAAIYSIVRGFLLEPLPYAREGELAVFWNPHDWSEAEFLHLQPEIPGFQGVAAYRPQNATLQPGEGPLRLVPGVAASAELFEVLGVRPLLGPGFQPGDDRQGAEPVAVLSHSLWRELGGDPAIIGQRLALDGVERTVVGVMPRGFWFPEPTVRVWLAADLNPENQSGRYAFVGRIAPGMSLDAMEGPLARITTALGERFEYPEQWDKTRNPSLTPIREYLVGSVRPALLATLAAMAVILLIACANVATLMLGQVEGRSGELAVRTALGAGRRRLLQQQVVEALAVGVLAGVVGAALAAAGFRLLVGALPLGALAEGVSLDWMLFLAAIAIAVVTALLIALVPGISIWRGDLRGILVGARTGGISGRGGRLESVLVVVEVALAVLMAAGAAVLIRSVANLRAIDPGVETRGVAVVDIAMAADIGADGRRQILRELIPGLEALPGVRSAAAVQKLPLRGSGHNWGITIEDDPDRPPSTTAFRMVSHGYFETLGIRVRDGRVFDSSDRADGELVVVINQALAQQYFPDVEPIGRRISTGFGWERIIGVVENVAEANLTDEPVPARYLLYEQIPAIFQDHTLVLRMAGGGEAAAVVGAARSTIHRVTPGVAVQQTTTMERVFTEALGPARQVMSLLTLLGGLALALGAIGVYGIVSHLVTRRKRDWGIRIALGQRPAQVVAQIVRRGGTLVAVGLVLGLLAFLVMARVLASFLYGVGAADPLALAAAAATLLIAGLLAAFVPARRASRIDPAVVLREQ